MRRYENSERNTPYRRGFVTEIDAQKGQVKVKFVDEDDNQSMWLPVNQQGSAANKIYDMGLALPHGLNVIANSSQGG